MTSSLQVSSASTIELFSELNWVSSSSNIDLASTIGTGPITTEKSFLSKDDVSFVYVLDTDNIVTKKKIKIGLKKNGFTEILSGINSKDLVIYEVINKIKEGTKVKLKWIFQSFLSKNQCSAPSLLYS